MTPREPDRYEEKADYLREHPIFRYVPPEARETVADLFAAALRAAADEALELAAQEIEHMPGHSNQASFARAVRTLASPTAARAAETVPETLPGDVEYEPSEPVAPAPPFVSDLVLDALQRCERARTANAHPPMLCVACAGEAARAARFPAPEKEPRK